MPPPFSEADWGRLGVIFYPVNFLPSQALRPRVAGYSIQESDGSGAAHEVLPGLQPVMGFQYRGRMSTLLPQGEILLETSGITALHRLYGMSGFYNICPRAGAIL